MKRRSTLLLFLMIIGCLPAQPVLQHTDLPAGTLTLNAYTITSVGTSDPTLNGENVTWDLSSATVALAGTATISPATATPFAAQFPAADRAFTYDLFGAQQIHNYHRAAANTFELVASNVPQATEIYTDHKQLLRFPFHFGTSTTDTYQKEGEPEQMVIWTYTGYGTLITSMGTIPNVVKITSSDGELIFWNTVPLYPLVIISSTMSVAHLPQPLNGVDEEVGSNISIHPNPAEDHLIINGHPAGARYVITDIVGREHASGRSNETGYTMLEIQHLATGKYQLHIQSTERWYVLPFMKR